MRFSSARAGYRGGMDYDFTTLPWGDAYKLIVGSVVPRPIGWISTLGPTGTPNLAPYSFFNAVCANPPMLMFAPVRLEGGRKKDSLANVERTREFVANIVTEETLPPMDASSAEVAEDVDEFELAGLTAVSSVVVKAPRVGEAPIHFECVLEHIVALGDGSEGAGELVIGRIVHADVAERVLRDGKVQLDLLHPVGRTGGPTYARPELLEFERKPQPDRRGSSCADVKVPCGRSRRIFGRTEER